MAEKKEKVATEAVAEEKTTAKKTAAKSAAKTEAKAPAKKTTAKTATEKAPAAKKTAAPKTTAAKTTVKKTAEKSVEAPAAEVVATEAPKAPKAAPAAKKTTKKAAAKAKAPLYINGRYVVEKQLPQKPQKGSSPYEAAKGKVKVTLVKSTVGCLDNQIATVKALGLTKIRTSNVLPDNAATRGMIFKVKHLVAVENVK